MSDQREPTEFEVRRQLAGLRQDPPDNGFSLKLHRALVESGPPEQPSVWERLRAGFRERAPVAWPLVGAAAGIAAFLLMSALFGGPPPTAPVAALEVPATAVPSGKIAVIRIDFVTDVAVEAADFQISLPDGIAFYADGEELPMRSFVWTQPLEEGNNEIPIAVRGQRPGRYLVTAVARVGEQRIEHEVLLEVTGS